MHILHHTGSQEEITPENPEEQETQVDEETKEEAQECPDHKPSTFERGKPRSILYLF